MEKRDGNIYFKIIVNIIIYVIFLIFLFTLVPQIVNFFLPFVVAWIIAWIANPLVKFLEKRLNLVRKYSSILIIFIVIALVVLVLYSLLSFIFEQSVVLVNELPNIVNMITNTLNQVALNLNQTISGFPISIQEPLIELGESVRISLIALFSNARIPEATIDFTRNIVDYTLFILIVFIASYFFIKESDRITKRIKAITPISIQERFELIQYHFKYALGGYVKAQLKLMLMVVIILYIGFKFLGVQYALLIALVTGFVDLLPIFGTGFIIWPWALIEFILGNYFMATFLMIIYLVCQFLKNVLQPKVVGDSVGIDTFTTFILMFIGYRLSGVVGLIFAVPIGLILYNLYKVGMFDNIIRGFKILFNDINKYRKF